MTSRVAQSARTRMNRWLFRAGATGFILGGAYEYDRYRYGSGLFRTIRTLGVGLIVTLDYKINFREGSSQQELDRIHDRCANLILDTCRKNGGLYIKFGQAIAMQSAVMPPQYAIFRQLYDDAPAVPFKDIEQVFSEDFGCHPDALFDDFERVPIASASIAQVHCAKIKGTNEKVAVKVQKLAIRKQLEWDLMAQEWTSRALSWAFDLPLAWSTEFTSQRLREEVDFIKEGRNSVEAARGIAAESRLRYRAYVPQVHWQLTAPRVLTAEFIDGVRLTDPEGIDRAGFSKAEIMETLVDVFAHQIFVGGTVHCDPHPGNVIVRVNPKQAPLLDRLFGTLLTPFAWLGLASNRLSDIQLVILDHGLYLHCSDSFRRQYAHLWRAMFTRDMTTLEHICKSWGIEDYTLFASATLMRPFTNSPREADRVSAPLHERVSGGIRMPTYVKTEEDVYAMHMRTKQRARKFLEHSERIPPEIVFIGRNMNIIRALNKMMGSPVNRIRIMGDWAVRAIGADWDAWTSDAATAGSATTQRDQSQLSAKRDEKGVNVGHRLSAMIDQLVMQMLDGVVARYNYICFKLVLLYMSMSFGIHNTRQSLLVWFTRRDTKTGFEDALDERMKEAVEKQFGFKVDFDA